MMQHECSQVIKEDMEIWAASQMWPFSCYSCEREGKCVPRLADLSPEELRWRVYEARGDSAAQAAYHDELRRLHEVATSVRRELARISPTNAQSLVRSPLLVLGGSNNFSVKFVVVFPPTEILYSEHLK